MMRLIPGWCLLCIFLLQCSPKNEQANNENEIKEMPVVKLLPTDTFLLKTYVAKIEAVRNVEIRNKVEGYLDKIYVDEGQQVRKGQLLFAINTAEYQSAVARAKAQLSNAIADAKEAEVQRKRVKLLVDKNIISKTEMDVANAAYDSKLARIAEARSVLANANTHLGYTYIRAPFNGIIDRIPLKTGSLLPEGTLLTTVSDINSVFAYFNMAEDEYLRYLRDGAVGHNKTVSLKLADGTRYPQAGLIETSTSEFQEGTGSIAFRARFPNPARLLRHGASGEVVLQTAAKNILLLPQKSVFEIQDKNYVYVVDQSGQVRIKSFQPLSRVAGYYIVRSGLQPGDRVVYEGTQSLKEGTRIRPVEKSSVELMQENDADRTTDHSSQSFAQLQ